MLLAGLAVGLLGVMVRGDRPAQAAQAAIALPPGFSMKTVVSGLRLPTDMVFLPNGDVLVTEKGSGFEAEGTARVRLVRDGLVQKQPLLELSASVQVDSGLASIVLDPNFTQNGFFYLWHATGLGSPGWDGEPVNRLTRYTFNLTDETVDPASAVVILDGVPWNEIHNGGGLSFDDAGNLLIATGDTAGALDAKRNNAQNYESLGGKVLRIRPKSAGGYSIPADNPYVDDPNVRPEVYAAGFRNPFRMTRRQADGEFFVADVGLDTWEEVDLIEPGANYGWPQREGPCPLATKGADCTPAPAPYTDPVLAYPLPPTGGSLTTMAFYEGTAFPEAYRNKLFFTDFNNRELFTADLTKSTVEFATFATGTGMYVDMEADANGIYMLDITTGEIVYLFYDGAGNQPPVPQVSASPALGRAPLNVTFSAQGTVDPDDLGLSFEWDFGDGTPVLKTSERVVEHEYKQDGNYVATMQAFDVRGGESQILTQEITVYSGAMPRVTVENQSEPGRLTFQGGDTIRFGVQRDGGTIGLDPTAPYRWDLNLHHNEHTHPVVADLVGDSVLLTIPTESHALETNIWYQAHLSMKTESGQIVEQTEAVYPDLVNLALNSWPGPIALKINQLVQPPDTVLSVIVGESYELEAPETLIYGKNVGTFDYWLVTDGWPATEGTPADLATPADAEILSSRVATIVPTTTPKSYVAHYRYARPASQHYLPVVPATAITQ